MPLAVNSTENYLDSRRGSEMLGLKRLPLKPCSMRNILLHDISMASPKD
jgi:hypothetical protein